MHYFTEIDLYTNFLDKSGKVLFCLNVRFKLFRDIFYLPITGFQI